MREREEKKKEKKISKERARVRSNEEWGKKGKHKCISWPKIKKTFDFFSAWNNNNHFVNNTVNVTKNVRARIVSSR